ncbi:hypothetical protein [Oceanobacillus neutriphilus]|nr:hypothetical protein [Oceanobacillus neutriphilus]
MKNKLTLSYCLDEECGWEETSPRDIGRLECPKCNSTAITEYAKEDNEFELLSSSSDMSHHKKSLDDAGIKYECTKNPLFGAECLIVEINSLEDLFELKYAVEEQLVLLNDETIEIYDSYRE